MGSLHAIWERFGDRIAFLVVYIREAHPEDGWVITMNRDKQIAIQDPTSDEQRQSVAASCAINLGIRMPVVVDKLDDAVARAYGGLPDRLYLIGRGGRVAYRGARGPFGFQPADLEAAIEAELARIDD